MRLFLILCLCALPLAAEEPLQTALERLRSEDPAVRLEARARLLAATMADVPAIQRFAEGETDVEARAAAQEIAEVLEYRTRRDVLEKAIFAVFEGEIEALERKGPKVLTVLGEILRYSRIVVGDDLTVWVALSGDNRGMGLVGRGESEDPGEDPVEVVVQRVGCALAALTLAEFGGNVEAWLDFISKHEGSDWQAIRMDGLVSRGYGVHSADPQEAASELLRAWTARVTSFGARECQMELCAEAESRALDGVLRTLLADLPTNQPEGLERFNGAESWLRLNRRDFEWRGGRLCSRAGPREFAERLADGDPLVRIAALWALDVRGGEIPAAGWNVIRDAPEFALRLMARTGHAVPADCTPSFFEATAALPSCLLEREPVLDPRALTKLVEDPSTEPIVRWRILRWLLLRADRTCFAIGAEEAGGGKDIPYPSTRSRYQPWDGIENPMALPVLVDACLGDESDVDRAENWLAAAGAHEAFLDIASALARRGRRTGLFVIGIRASIGLPAQFRTVARSLVEGAPSGDDAAEWRAWGDLDPDHYEWDPVRQLWAPHP